MPKYRVELLYQVLEQAESLGEDIDTKKFEVKYVLSFSLLQNLIEKSYN